MKTIFEISRTGRTGASLPQSDVGDRVITDMIPGWCIRENTPEIPEVSESDVVRHFTALSRRNHGVDSGFYPLGSCTMKYNPKVNEDIASLEGFTAIHPLQPEETIQGCLEVMYNMSRLLCEITGMDEVSLMPAAGAHGEITGLMIIKAYHDCKGDSGRNEMIIPDSAHGTNPASAAMAGFKVVEVKSDERGCIDIASLKSVLSGKTAGMMLTNPNTLGLFEENVDKVADMVHDAGGLLYYDGANLNAVMGIARPGDMGFDVVHVNLHKTFGTPHGGGGPGSGPVGVKKSLAKFLPAPVIAYNGSRYSLNYDLPDSIGKVKAFYGNFGVILKAYAYILSMGAGGLKQASEDAVLNANYVMNKLKKYYHLPYDRACKHEFVLSGVRQKEKGVSTLDIAKRLLDFGVHPPTIYFPLIVREALMIEPTETESIETLDEFVETMIKIAQEVETDPERVKQAPHEMVVGRLDDVLAARKPRLRWKKEETD